MKLHLIILICLLCAFAAACAVDEDDSSSKSAPPIDDDTATDDSADDDTHSGDDTAPGVFSAGFARVDVTPEESVIMAGYGTFFLSPSLCRWSTGVHDPLYASAVAFEDPDGAPMILVSLDNVGMVDSDVAAIAFGISAEIDIPLDRVVVGATHTHHGPDTIGVWGVMLPPISGRQDEAVARMIDGAIDAGVEAWNARVPSTIKHAQGLTADLHENIIEEDPLRTIDDAMSLLAVYDGEGALLGTIMNWACHATVMGQDNTLISADFPGAYSRMMEEDLGGTHVFFNGALGAMIQPTNKWSDPDEWDEVDATGRALADDAQALLADAAPTDAPAIENFTAMTVPITLTNPVIALAGKVGLIARAMPPLGGMAHLPIVSFKLGPVFFATLPGEFVPDYSLALRDIMGGDTQFIIGLGNDWAGYILTPRQAWLPCYLYERVLDPDPNAGEAVTAAYRDILKE